MKLELEEFLSGDLETRVCLRSTRRELERGSDRRMERKMTEEYSFEV